ncbi:MAG: hypothetical protein ACD_72C00099G0001 [uncultured bacterium]|nr:MAG: hypothetical protein ACD_72C00099G0001 [uncultured bacterium]
MATIIIESKIEFNKLVFWLWLGGVVQSVLAIVQFFVQSVWANKWLGMASHSADQLGVAVLDFGGERFLRSYGSFGWPNALGIYLSAIFLLGIVSICHFHRHSRENGNLENKKDFRFHGNDSLMLLIGQIVILAGLFFTFARGAWLAVILGIIILVVKNYKNKILWQQLFIYSLVGIILLFIFKPLVFSRVNFQNRLERKSVSERIEQWQDWKIVFSQNKFLGVGPGAYTYGLFFYKLDRSHDFQPIHNIYLLLVAEWGIIGIGGLWLFIYYIHKRIDWLFTPLLSALFAGLFDHWTVSMFTGLLFLAILFALAVKIKNIDNADSKE